MEWEPFVVDFKGSDRQCMMVELRSDFFRIQLRHIKRFNDV